MSQKSGFFNSIDGDRKYLAQDFARYFGVLVSNGIFYNNNNSLRVTVDSGMTVNVLSGDAWISGYQYSNDSNLPLTLVIGNSTNPRIDRIVLRWSLDDRSITAAVKQGTPAANPSAPALTRNTTTYELALADIRVNAAATTITASNITDQRLNTSLCGEVNSLVRAVYE